MIDWSKILIRCSSLGELMTEPQDAATKKSDGLSKTAISHLTKIYAWEKWGRRKDITTNAMEKGILCEEDSITLLSRVEKKMYQKNKVRLNNDFFTGLPDVVCDDEVGDIKSSWDSETFLPKEVESINRSNYWQIQGYCDLKQVERGWLAYCLVSAPFQIVESERKKLLWNMNVISEESPEFKEAEKELLHNMIFDDIPIKERVIKFEVKRNGEDIERARQKVIKAREWLTGFDLKRTSRYKYQV